jgi:hypothetical protein
MEPKTFLEPADVARETGLSGSSVRELANRGELEVAARTRRGLRLLSPAVVARFKRQREARRAGGR